MTAPRKMIDGNPSNWSFGPIPVPWKTSISDPDSDRKIGFSSALVDTVPGQSGFPNVPTVFPGIAPPDSPSTPLLTRLKALSSKGFAGYCSSGPSKVIGITRHCSPSFIFSSCSIASGDSRSCSVHCCSKMFSKAGGGGGTGSFVAWATVGFEVVDIVVKC